MVIIPLIANAEAVEINGIYYNLINTGHKAEVTSNPTKYTGDVVIPPSITVDHIDYNVNSIGDEAFLNCNGLISINLPTSIVSIGNSAFTNCIQLTDVTIPNSVTTIGKHAFSYTGLTSLTIGSNVLSIDNGAFEFCYGLTSVIIPNSVNTIGQSVFSNCIHLTSVTIPNSVTSIGGWAFEYCNSLTSVTIPNGITNINDYTFSGCSSLTSVTIPNGVTRISQYAFYGCIGLTTIVIPNQVSSILSHSFYGCSNLKTIIIGSWVQNIGEKAFANCPELSDVYCLAENVLNVSSDAFQNSNIDCTTLHVPVGFVATYRSAEPWSSFNRIIDYDEVNISANNVRSYSSVFDLDFSGVTGLSAYVISNYDASEGTLTLTPVTTVPAGEGLLLKGNAGDYVLPYTTTDATYTNYLVGMPTTTSVSPTDGAYTNFILANGSYGVNFYPLSTTGDIAGGKAYLKLPTASLSARMKLSFTDGETTAIENIKVMEPTDNIIYDLQGRKVDQPTKGLYILNGKKVIIK